MFFFLGNAGEVNLGEGLVIVHNVHELLFHLIILRSGTAKKTSKAGGNTVSVALVGERGLI